MPDKHDGLMFVRVASVAILFPSCNKYIESRKLEVVICAEKHLIIYESSTRESSAMNFGIGVGDVIALAQLAIAVRRQFVDAPSQFKAISDECVV